MLFSKNFLKLFLLCVFISKISGQHADQIVDKSICTFNPDIDITDISNLELFGEAGKEVQDISNIIQKSEFLRDQGITLDSRFLLYGPKGCGKTTLAYMIAHIFKGKLIHISGKNFINGSFGGGPDSIWKVFENATKLEQRIIIFIDDINFMAKETTDSLEASNAISDLRSCLNYVQHNPLLCVIFTADNLRNLDKGLIDRLDRIKLELPSKELRKKIIAYYLKQYSLNNIYPSDKENLEMIEKMAYETDFFS